MVNRDKIHIEIVIVSALILFLLFTTSFILSIPFMTLYEKLAQWFNFKIKVPKIGIVVLLDVLAIVKVCLSIRNMRLAFRYSKVLNTMPPRTCTQDIAISQHTSNKKIVKQLSMLVRKHYFYDSFYTARTNSFGIRGGKQIVFIGAHIPQFNDAWNNGTAEMRNWGKY